MPDLTAQVCARCSHWLQFSLDLFRKPLKGERSAHGREREVVPCKLGCCSFILTVTYQEGGVFATFTCNSFRNGTEWLHSYTKCCICSKLALDTVRQLELSRGDHHKAWHVCSGREQVFMCAPLGAPNQKEAWKSLLLFNGNGKEKIELSLIGSVPSGCISATCIDAMTDANAYQLAQLEDAVEVETNHGLEDRRLDMIKSWIADCRRHSDCSSKNTEGFRPSRLIFIGKDKKADPVRLVEVWDNAMQDEPYATLSHCWGGKKVVTLKKENFGAFQASIPTENLTKTFAHAILLCRKLGIRWLWIDSLCIIQDDEADWARQSSRMHDVYRFGFLNIAANGSFSSLGGLFRPFRHYALLPVNIVVDPFAGGLSLCEMGHQATEDLLKEEEEAALWKRGWVMQERFFSHRQLIFGTNQILWLCRKQNDFECARRQQKPSLWSGRSTAWLRQDDSITNINSQMSAASLGKLSRYIPWSSHEKLDDVWKRVCELYSRTEVTFARDKMIAFSGIAQEFGVLYGRTKIRTAYAAGLWMHNLFAGLLWHREDASNSTLLPESSIAPSWSWISAASQARRYEPVAPLLKNWSKYVPLATLIESCITPLDSALPHGPCSGTITMRAQLIPSAACCKSGRLVSSPDFNFSVRRLAPNTHNFTHEALVGRADPRRPNEYQLLHIARIILDWLPDGTEDDTQLDTAYLLPIIYMDGRYPDQTLKRYHGIIVEEVQNNDNKHAMFRRLGYWEMNLVGSYVVDVFRSRYRKEIILA